MTQEYKSFIFSKEKSQIESGFDVAKKLSHCLFDFQAYCVTNALKYGRYAIFADCGLGKTLMQLEWASQVHAYTNEPVIILAPLAVVQQTIREGVKFGFDVRKYDGSNFPIQITNYEQLKNIDTSIFSGVVLDESSILKNVDGSTCNAIIEAFRSTPYKLACTATPSPNDPMELGTHAEFLGVMSRNEMLAMYFVHDGGNTSKWRLKKHSVSSFYGFVSQWAVMLSHPRDIGYDVEGYDLPSLNIITHTVETEKVDNGLLFNDMAVSATNFNKELRRTTGDRIQKALDIVDGKPNTQFIIWVKQNQEADALKKLIPHAVEVRGDHSDEYKADAFLRFSNGEFNVLITKTKIASFGLNFQNCSNQVFLGIDFSFEMLYQAIRRSYRFGQKNEVNIHIITTDTMTNVQESIKVKDEQFKLMQMQMSESTMNRILNGDTQESVIDTTAVVNESYSIYRGDCVELIKDIPSGSIGLSVFSPPFAELYTYSNHVEDMGNSKDYKQFLTHFSFLVSELERVMMDGRIVAVHCMDLPVQKGKEGYIGLRDFSGMIRDSFESNGFIYHSRVTIWKNPVVEMQRTKALGLLHKQVCKDSTMSRVGIPDYVMIFRKKGVNPKPIQNKGISVDLWQKYASPIWYDINYGKTLQGKEDARDGNDEKHIAPLQLETIERLVHLYSNEGDRVLTPFMGIGSEVYEAIRMNRYGIGFELKESYFDIAKRNIASCVEKKNQQSLFELV